MRCGNYSYALLILLGLTFQGFGADKSICLHPENAHYFYWRGEPTILITSGEHYGAVLNQDFDYHKYLKTLESYGFNLTRTFSGVYCEPAGAFHIAHNSLAPAKRRFLCPWARSHQPGYANGGNKFDLTQGDPKYFQRLRDFVAEAGRRGVVVEMVLFCTMYSDSMWQFSPLYGKNNINGVGNIKRNEVFTLKDKRLTTIQETMVRKIVQELNTFDNVYFEICNEPYERGGQTSAWQNRMAKAIVETEANLPNQHLIAQNLPWRKQNLPKKGVLPGPHVSILNFHGTSAPIVWDSYHNFNKVLAFDETGGSDRSATPYRIAGWDFILSGGAVFDHLDFSFAVGHEDGTAKVNAPGGGGPEIRQQLRILKEFIYGIDFIQMRPDKSFIREISPANINACAFVQKGKTYAIHLTGGRQANLVIELPKGPYRSEWLNTKTGTVEKQIQMQHQGGTITLASPKYTDDIALRILRLN